MWAGTLGYTAGSALSHHHCANPHTCTYTHTDTHTPQLQKVSFIWGLELSYHVRTAPKILPTLTYTLQRKEGRVFWQPQCRLRPNPPISLSLFLPPHVCLSLQCLERGWNYCPAHTHRCKQTDTKQCLYWGISTVHSTKTEFTIVDHPPHSREQWLCRYGGQIHDLVNMMT